MAQLSLLVLAAGMGSRYGGLKQLDPMGPSGETLLDYSVYDALKAGADRVVFIIRKDIEEEFRAKVGARYDGKIAVDYVFQQLDVLPEGFAVPEERKKPWGTAHAIWCARDVVKEPFIAINADDYYGVKSYQLVGDFLQANRGQETRFVMAGYRLGNTVSEHGSVARGVCKVDESGELLSIVEHTGITLEGGRIVEKGGSGAEQEFDGNEPVSMNFWGLTPSVFPLLEEQLKDFLKNESSDPKAEFYIPMALGAAVAKKQATLNVVPTDAPWFGVTYREDKPLVQDALAKLHANGTYPTPLWAA
jgi:NDP-sugar pyrophosphorylase family protein